MDIRIDYIPCRTKRVVRISGRLTRDMVAQLEQASQPHKNHWVMDLTDMLYADEAGVSTLRSLIQRGVRVRGALPFIVLLLNNRLGRPTNIQF
jgi:ABC-type transporter Mla MlaB component